MKPWAEAGRAGVPAAEGKGMAFLPTPGFDAGSLTGVGAFEPGGPCTCIQSVKRWRVGTAEEKDAPSCSPRRTSQ